MRSLMDEEEEFMEIDTPLGTTQKRFIGKAKVIERRRSNKKNRSEEVLRITAPKKREPKYWMGFSYMEQMAMEAGIPECISDGLVEDLVATRYIRAKAKELGTTKVAFPRITQ